MRCAIRAADRASNSFRHFRQSALCHFCLRIKMKPLPSYTAPTPIVNHSCVPTQYYGAKELNKPKRGRTFFDARRPSRDGEEDYLGGRNAKLTSSCVSIGLPLSVVGLYFHWRTAVMAACISGSGPLRGSKL